MRPRTATMTGRRAEKIRERRRQVSRLYQGIYDRAIEGKSLRACIDAFCLECVCSQRVEITDCTDLACPLYAVRPYQDDDETPHDRAQASRYPPLEGPSFRAESTNGPEGVSQAITARMGNKTQEAVP